MKNTLFARVKRCLRRTMFACGLFTPLAEKLAKTIQVHAPANPDARHTLLALKPERFRGDLDILAADYGFRILKLKKGWQQKMLEFFWESNFSLDHDYFYPEQGSMAERIQKRTRAFLRRFLPILLKRLEVDCVLSAATYYLDDWDYANVLDEMGFPLVVIYRECFQASQKDIDFQVEVAAKLRRFQGSHLIVHNEIIRQAFIDCGYIEAHKISAPGCMRMDPFVKTIEKERSKTREPGRRKKAAFFSFVHCIGLPHLCNDFTREREIGFVELFDKTHIAFIKLAVEHPEMDFVLKPKWGGSWVDEMQIPLTPHGIDIRKIGNLEILPDADAQQVILDSDVIVGFGSTVLLEAGIAARPVIIPHFAEALDPKYEEYVLLKDDYDAFDIATSPEHLRELILKRLENPEVPEQALQQRKDAFERYVSPMCGNASEQYAAIIREVLEKG